MERAEVRSYHYVKEFLMENTIDTSIINSILIRYGITANVVAQKIYIYDVDTSNYIKVIFRVSLESGKMLVIKIVREEDDLPNYIQKAEQQNKKSII